jgi:hypothetical protein
MTQEINLLQDKAKGSLYQWDHKQNLIIIILSAVLIIVAAGFGGLMGLNIGKVKQIEQVKQENAVVAGELAKSKSNLTDAISYQAQTENLKVLLDNHIYFSTAIKEITSYMYKSATVDMISVELSGKVHVEGSASSYSEIGKYLLGLYSSKNISDVNLLSTSPTQGEESGYKFSLDFLLAPKAFQAP